MSTAAVAAGLTSAALFLVVAAAVFFVYGARLWRRDERPEMGALWCWRWCRWTSRPEKVGRDAEKGQTTARVADGPDHTPEPAIKGESKKREEGSVPGVSAVQKFGWTEVEDMTGSFSSAVIGEGGFSTVYLARLGEGGASSPLGAVKVHRSSSGSERLHRAFRQELEVLLNLRHPNIVRLLGYCEDREEGVLVLEYVPNGTLHEKLHGGGGDGTGLPWARRMSIALQLARAVEYLHDGCTLPIVHCDLKASNVLLDGRLDCKLCDFGSARAGFESAVAQHRLHPTMMGSPGYVDPHYLRTGMVSKKGDVYSFGVVLLELLTGAEAFCTEKGQMLTAAVGKSLAEGVGEVVDRRLGGRYDTAEAAAVGALAASCIGEQPSLRPSMAETVRTLEAALPTSIAAVGAKPS